MRFTVAGFTLLGAAIASSQASTQCKTYPGDSAWPSTTEWNYLNKTVGGRLVKTVPLGSPCHGSTYDSATCGSLREQWQAEKIQYVPTTLIL